MHDPRFPPVSLLAPRELVAEPQRLPGSPSAFTAQAVIRPSGFAAQAPSFSPTETSAPRVFDSHHYANVSDLFNAIPNGSSILILEAPSGLRNYLMLRNCSATANIYIGFGNDASPNSTLKLEAGQIALFDTVLPQNDLYAYGDAVSAFLAFSYSNIPG